MSIRALWVMSFTDDEKPHCLFVKRFATVDKRSKMKEKEHFVPIPTVEEFCSIICDLRRRNVVDIDAPVLTLQTATGDLWPLVCVKQASLTFYAVSSVEQGSHTKPPLVQIPGIAAAFTIILGIIEFLGNLPQNVEGTHQKFLELTEYLGVAAPFGMPITMNPTIVKSLLTTKSSSSTPSGVKQPAWKPLNYKGKAQLQFVVREQVRAVLYDRDDVQDVMDIHGTIMSRVDLEGTLPSVVVSFNHSNPASGLPLEHIITHPFVQSKLAFGNFIAGAGSKGEDNTCTLQFTPPLESFALMHYTGMRNATVLPINGFYQMKGEQNVEFLLQLKLNRMVKNSFEYFEVQIPFFHRGSIKSFDATPSVGNVVCPADKSILVWNIGQKFPSKTLEATLKATVKFPFYKPRKGSSPEESFCVGQNSYVQMVFKISDYTHSGIQLDPKGVQVIPNSKFKLTSSREFLSGEYKIWNSHGKAIEAFQPDDSLCQMLYEDNNNTTD